MAQMVDPSIQTLDSTPSTLRLGSTTKVHGKRKRAVEDQGENPSTRSRNNDQNSMVEDIDAYFDMDALSNGPFVPGPFFHDSWQSHMSNS